MTKRTNRPGADAPRPESRRGVRNDDAWNAGSAAVALGDPPARAGRSAKRPKSLAREDGVEPRVFQSIRRIIRAVDLHSHKLADQYGVTVPQLTCLLKLVESGEMTCGELARSVSLSPSTVVGILDRLTAKGFIVSERSREDRRQVRIRASREGAEFARKCPSPLHDKLAGAMAGLSVRERHGIAAALERIVELMEIGGVDAAPILDSGRRLDSHPGGTGGKTGKKGGSDRG